MIQTQFANLLILITLAISLIACRNVADDPSTENPLDFVCLPYTVSNEKTKETYFLEPFGRIESEVNAEIIYNVLPDKSTKPYITLEGHKDIIDRMEWEVKYNNLFNQHELKIKYSKCMIKSRNRLVKINVFSHELFEVKISEGGFVSTDTITSNVGKLSLYDAGGCYFNIVCNVPILFTDLTSVSYFVLNGIADSCAFYIRPNGEKSPLEPSNLRNLKYRSLYFLAIAQPFWRDEPKSINVFAGSPERISYFVDRSEYKLYYQGSPEIIGLTPYNPLIWEP